MKITFHENIQAPNVRLASIPFKLLDKNIQDFIIEANKKYDLVEQKSYAYHDNIHYSFIYCRDVNNVVHRIDVDLRSECVEGPALTTEMLLEKGFERSYRDSDNITRWTKNTQTIQEEFGRFHAIVELTSLDALNAFIALGV